MSPLLSKIVLIATVLAGVCVTAYRPEWISDDNVFLKNFVNHEYLNILGVILAITLASLSQLHLVLGRVEKKIGKGILDDVRAEIKSSATYLIVGFILGLLAVVAKPLIVWGPSGEAIVNAFSLVILVFYILILSDITLSVFDLDLGDDDAES